jgi:hypothetical protein
VNADLLKALSRLPFPRLLGENGFAESGNPCPFCKGPAELSQSGSFSKEWLERLRVSVDLVAEIQSAGVQLKKKGANLVGCCPFHAEKGPSFNVIPAKHFYKCFGCNASGDVIKFTMEHRKLPFPEAVRYLAGVARVEPEFESDARWWFRCANAQCVSRQRLKGDTELRDQLDEVGFLQVLHGLARNEAFVSYLQQAGVTGARALPSSTLPGAPKRRVRLPQETPPPLPAVPPPPPISQPASVSPESPAVPATDTPPLGAPAEDSAGDSPTPEDLLLLAAGGVPGSSVIRPMCEVSGLGTISADEVQAYLGGTPANEQRAKVKAADPAAEADPETPADKSKPRVVNEDDLPVLATRAFYQALNYRDSDGAKTWRKRGLCRSVQRLFGLRSGERENEAKLVALADRFPMWALEKAGLWVRSRGEIRDRRRNVTVRDGFQPNPQYFGLGLGREKDANGKRKFEWADEGDEPILIPYFDWDGHPLIEEGAATPAEIGVIENALLTEGEFKAMALWVVFCLGKRWLAADSWEPPVDRLVALRPHKGGAAGVASRFYTTPTLGGMAAGALPGVTFARRELETAATGAYSVRVALESWLKSLDPRQVTIAYDVEEKRDYERFPAAFKPAFERDREQGYAPIIWGLFLAQELERRGQHVHYWSLPAGFLGGEADWRDDAGKADFDGELGRRMRA